jgi:tetratricopeptide (TPR) repeat protein
MRAYLRETSPARVAADLGRGAADVARVVPELQDTLPSLADPPALDADQERFLLFDSVTTFLKNLARRAPLLLVLDDLQWADRSSLFLLEFLADEMRDSALLVIGTYRDAGVDRQHPLSRTLAKFSRLELGTSLRLDGLNAEHVARFSELASGQPAPVGLVEAIHEQTEGNPFFVKEVVRLLIDEGRFVQPEDVRSWRITVPQGVRQTIGLRLDRLSADANQVLAIAAVMGREFDLPVLEHVCELPAEHVLAVLEEALDSGALAEMPTRPGAFRFAHVLIRQTLYEELSNARRLRLHQRIGTTIEQVYATDLTPHVEDLAYHFYLAVPAGEVERAIQYAVQAGQQSLAHVAYAEAAAHFERALQVLERQSPTADTRRCELLLLLGEAQKNAGDPIDAKATFERVAEIARRIEDADLFARAALGIAESAFDSEYWYESLIGVLEEALAKLPTEDSILRVRVMSRLARALEDRPNSLDTMRQLSHEAVDAARRLDNAGTLAVALTSRLLAFWTPEDIATRLRNANEIMRLAQLAGDRRLVLTARAWRLLDLVELGDVAAVDRELDVYERAASELRQAQYRWGVGIRRAMRALMTGDYGAAERLAIDARDAGQRSMAAPANANFIMQMFVLWRDQGRIAEVESELRAMAHTYPAIHFWSCMLAVVYLEIRQSQLSQDILDRYQRDGFESIPKDSYWLASLAMLSEVCGAHGRDDQAAQLYQHMLPFAGRLVSPGNNAICLGPVAYYLGLLATSAGQWEDAVAHFIAAKETCERTGMHPWKARVLCAHLNLIRQSDGDQHVQSTQELLGEAHEICQRYGMRELHRRLPPTVQDGERKAG